METRRAAFRVGLFTLTGLLALLALVFFLSGSALHPGIKYETYFQESVQGLDVGTAVKFRGVTIGKVTDVGLVSAEYPPPDTEAVNQKVYQQVVVRFEVNPKKIGHVEDIETAVAHGLRVQIAPQGITGLAYVELSFVNPQQYPASSVPWTPDSTVIPSMPSTLNQVQDAIENVLSSMSKVDIGKMITEVSDLMTVLDQEITTGDAHQAIANANSLLINLNQQLTASDIAGTTAAVRNLAGGPQTLQILHQLNQSTAALAKASAALPALLAQSQATLGQAGETTSDLQAGLAPILQDLQATAANLRQLSSSLKRNPAQLLNGAPPRPQGEH